jgi:Flp pilus assembly CpaE family ATPase
VSAPSVALALTPPAERAIEPLLFGRDAVVEPRLSISDADELDHELDSTPLTTALISADLPGLTAAHCARARAAGLRLVGLALHPNDQQQLHALGVDQVLDADTTADELLAAIHGADAPEQDTAAPTQQAERVRRASRSVGGRVDGGSVLAVVGSKGAPGASECAASLATLSAARWSSVLVELDMLGGALDLRLGADARQGSLLGLVRAACSADGAPRDLLERWLATRNGWPPVLLSPPDLPHTVSELAQPGAVSACLRSLAAIFPLTVLDVGFLLTNGDQTDSASLVHREALVCADAVLLVIGAREEQLRAGLAQLDNLLALGIPAERLRVAVNGAGGPAAATRTALEQILPPHLAERHFVTDVWLPWDQRAQRSARRSGLPLATTCRRSSYGRALTTLLDELFLPTAPEPRQRKLRLVPPQTTTAPPQPETQPEESAGEPAEREVALPWRR